MVSGGASLTADGATPGFAARVRREQSAQGSAAGAGAAPTDCPPDYPKKLAHGLIVRFDGIALEDSHVENMVRHRHLAKSMLDAGRSYLKQHLAHKAEEAGRVVYLVNLVNPAHTSKARSHCGAVFQDPMLADRWLRCDCGLSLDRDVNAALNIL